MGFLFRYGLWVAALAIIVGYLVRFLREARRDPVTGRYRIDPTSFEPLSSYIGRRGELTQRDGLGTVDSLSADDRCFPIYIGERHWTVIMQSAM